MPLLDTTHSRILAGLTLAVCLAAGWSAGAEREPPRDKDDSEAAERDEILLGPVWLETMRAWDEWLNTQKIYDKQQVKKLKQQLAAKVERMSPRELEDLLDEMQAKLDILMGAEARDARRWLSETLSVASEQYAKKVRAGLPDVANISAVELQEDLDRFEERRAQTQQLRDAFQQSRQARVKVVQAELRQQHDDSQKALDRAAQSQSAGARGNHFVRSDLHNRKSVSDRQPFWLGIGFW
jgi:hypothetical protein